MNTDANTQTHTNTQEHALGYLKDAVEVLGSPVAGGCARAGSGADRQHVYKLRRDACIDRARVE